MGKYPNITREQAAKALFKAARNTSWQHVSVKDWTARLGRLSDEAVRELYVEAERIAEAFSKKGNPSDKGKLQFIRYIASTPSDPYAGVAEMSDRNAWSFEHGRLVSNHGPVVEFIEQVKRGRWRYKLVESDWQPRSNPWTAIGYVDPHALKVSIKGSLVMIRALSRGSNFVDAKRLSEYLTDIHLALNGLGLAKGADTVSQVNHLIKHKIPFSIKNVECSLSNVVDELDSYISLHNNPHTFKLTRKQKTFEKRRRKLQRAFAFQGFLPKHNPIACPVCTSPVYFTSNRVSCDQCKTVMYKVRP